MLDKLELIRDRWQTVEGELSSPDAMADPKLHTISDLFKTIQSIS